jgi:hypothetical protein
VGRPGRVATTYSFAVLALLIAISGVLAALNAPTAIFPSLKPLLRRTSPFLDVVTAQSTALEDERLAIALHSRQLVADIGLMLALGGGWTVPPEPRAKPLLAPYLAE